MFDPEADPNSTAFLFTPHTFAVFSLSLTSLLDVASTNFGGLPSNASSTSAGNSSALSTSDSGVSLASSLESGALRMSLTDPFPLKDDLRLHSFQLITAILGDLHRPGSHADTVVVWDSTTGNRENDGGTRPVALCLMPRRSPACTGEQGLFKQGEGFELEQVDIVEEAHAESQFLYHDERDAIDHNPKTYPIEFSAPNGKKSKPKDEHLSAPLFLAILSTSTETPRKGSKHVSPNQWEEKSRIKRCGVDIGFGHQTGSFADLRPQLRVWRTPGLISLAALENVEEEHTEKSHQPSDEDVAKVNGEAKNHFTHLFHQTGRDPNAKKKLRRQSSSSGAGSQTDKPNQQHSPAGMEVCRTPHLIYWPGVAAVPWLTLKEYSWSLKSGPRVSINIVRPESRNKFSFLGRPPKSMVYGQLEERRREESTGAQAKLQQYRASIGRTWRRGGKEERDTRRRFPAQFGDDVA
ncbi:hypothetical protein K438DRAFT_1777037 [Mycena galopus ATCC 62051]|nr:hypothetical protein K438DRAFT_1777037 [Mycena galopus ATCC 62051]